MPDLWVDFNDVDKKGQLMTLLKFATPGVDLHHGARVLVGDGEGSECLATVLEVVDQFVYLHLDMDTFRDVEVELVTT